MISPTYSLLRGAVIQPALGVNELLARTGLFGEAVKQGAIRNVQQEQLMSETLKKRQAEKVLMSLSLQVLYFRL